jgi:mRNA-degrading endonuclease YafQ of YafQ-DinJ toxin-antitoxin module
MTTRFLNSFQRDFQAIPTHIQKKFQRQLKTVITLGIRYPGLSVRKMSGQTEIWEARIDEHYRFTFQMVDEVMILRRVGTHEIYRKP